VFEGGAHRKVPQIGECFIEDDVEVGANTTIDRGSIGATRIGQGAKVDNLVQLAHNSVVGPLTMLASQVGVAGSTELGKGVIVGGQAGFAGHISVGDGARVAGQSGITGDVAAGETVMGFPARPRMEFLRMIAAQGRGDRILRAMREFERRLSDLEGERDEERNSP
jgi:UDP-3-O-[3-hydroxymyristoyl] glucosamine N-acyltransferase